MVCWCVCVWVRVRSMRNRIDNGFGFGKTACAWAVL